MIKMKHQVRTPPQPLNTRFEPNHIHKAAAAAATDEDDDFIVYQVHLEQNPQPILENNNSILNHVSKKSKTPKRSFFEKMKSTSTNDMLLEENNNHSSSRTTSKNNHTKKRSQLSLQQQQHQQQQSQSNSHHQIEIEFDLDPLPERDERIWFSTNDVSLTTEQQAQQQQAHYYLNDRHRASGSGGLKSSKSSNSLISTTNTRSGILKKLKQIHRPVAAADEEELRFEHNLEKALGNYVTPNNNNDNDYKVNSKSKRSSSSRSNGLKKCIDSSTSFSSNNAAAVVVDLMNDSPLLSPSSNSMNSKPVKVPITNSNHMRSKIPLKVELIKTTTTMKRNQRDWEDHHHHQVNDDDDEISSGSTYASGNSIHEPPLADDSNHRNQPKLSQLKTSNNIRGKSRSSHAINDDCSSRNVNSHNGFSNIVDDRSCVAVKPQKKFSLQRNRNPLVVTFNFHKLHPADEKNDDSCENLSSRSSSSSVSVSASILTIDDSEDGDERPPIVIRNYKTKITSSKSKSISLPEKLWNELFHRKGATSTTSVRNSKKFSGEKDGSTKNSYRKSKKNGFFKKRRRNPDSSGANDKNSEEMLEVDRMDASIGQEQSIIASSSAGASAVTDSLDFDMEQLLNAADGTDDEQLRLNKQTNHNDSCKSTLSKNNESKTMSKNNSNKKVDKKKTNKITTKHKKEKAKRKLSSSQIETNQEQQDNDDGDNSMIVIDDNQDDLNGNNDEAGLGNPNSSSKTKNKKDNKDESKWKYFLGKLKNSSTSTSKKHDIIDEKRLKRRSSKSTDYLNNTEDEDDVVDPNVDDEETHDEEFVKTSQSFESIKNILRKSARFTKKKNKAKVVMNSNEQEDAHCSTSSSSMISKLKVDNEKEDDDDDEQDEKSNPSLSIHHHQQQNQLLVDNIELSSSSSISTSTVPINSSGSSSKKVVVSTNNFFRSFRLKKNKVSYTGPGEVEKNREEEAETELDEKKMTKTKFEKVGLTATSSRPQPTFFFTSTSDEGPEKVLTDPDVLEEKEGNQLSMTSNHFDRRSQGGGGSGSGFGKVNHRLFSSFYHTRKSRRLTDNTNAYANSGPGSLFLREELDDVTLDLASGQLKNTNDGSVIGRANVIVEPGTTHHQQSSQEQEQEEVPKIIKKNGPSALAFYIKKSSHRKSGRGAAAVGGSSAVLQSGIPSSSTPSSLLLFDGTDGDPPSIFSPPPPPLPTNLYSDKEQKKRKKSVVKKDSKEIDKTDLPSSSTKKQQLSSKKSKELKKSQKESIIDETGDGVAAGAGGENESQDDVFNSPDSNSASPTKSSSFIGRVKEKSKKLRRFSLKNNNSKNDESTNISSSPSTSSNIGDSRNSRIFESETDNPLFTDGDDLNVYFQQQHGYSSKAIDIVRPTNLTDHHISEEEGGLSSLPNSLAGGGGNGRNSGLGSLSLSETDEYTGPFVGKAIALVDCTPSPYDRHALRYKKGDIIEIISKKPTGIWTGKVNGQVGHFKFINIEILPNVSDEDELDSLGSHDDVGNAGDDYGNYSGGSQNNNSKVRRRTKRSTPMTPWELEQRQTVAAVINGIRKENAALLINSHSTGSLVGDNDSSSQSFQQQQHSSSTSTGNNSSTTEENNGTTTTTTGRRRTSSSSAARQGRPKSVGDLLRRINLEEHISVFILHGFESLDLFKELEEEDLDRLAIVNPSDRGKLLTAVELLREFDTEEEIPPMIIPTYSTTSPNYGQHGGSDELVNDNNDGENIITPPPNFTRTCGKIVRDSGVFVKCDDDELLGKEQEDDFDKIESGEISNVKDPDVDEIILSPANLPIEVARQKAGVKMMSQVGNNNKGCTQSNNNNKNRSANTNSKSNENFKVSSVRQRFLNAKSMFESSGPSTSSQSESRNSTPLSGVVVGLDGHVVVPNNSTTTNLKSPKDDPKMNARFLYCEKSSDSGISVGANSPPLAVTRTE